MIKAQLLPQNKDHFMSLYNWDIKEIETQFCNYDADIY